MQCGAMRCGVLSCNAVSCLVLSCGVMSCNAVRCCVMQCRVVRVMQCGAMRCGAVSCCIIGKFAWPVGLGAREFFNTCFYRLRYLDDVALHHLVDALCRLSTTSMEQTQSNKVHAASQLTYY